MNIFEIENFFANSSFVLLFLSMISYWVQIAFNMKRNIGKFFMISANFCLLSLLIFRWKESGHFPLSNLYESLIFLSWSLSTFHLILENIESGTNAFLNFEQIFQIFDKNKVENVSEKQSFVGAFTSPTALFINAFATFRLPLEMQHSSPLVPALQSNWLMMHVTVMILSYSALICGSLLSIAFLIITKNLKLDLNTPQDSPQKDLQFSSPIGLQNSVSTQVSLVSNKDTSFLSLESSSINTISETKNMQKSLSSSNEEKSVDNSLKKKFAENLDNLSYRILGIGFPLLTIGILSGAVWANEAWGSYWSWDPKETWALATWFVFAIYLHTRLTKGWKGKKPAIIASLGFVAVWVCFLGVNLLGEGLHSYGFLKDSL